MLKYFFFIPALFLAELAQAKDFGAFDSLWSDIYKKSHSIQASQLEVQAADAAKSRATLHWLPSLSLSASALSTNDPTTVLFSNLSTRSVQATDFTPSLLNNPERQWFERGTLSLDLPLYEGGSKSHLSSGKTLEAESIALKSKLEAKEEYAMITRQYAQLASLRIEQQRLQELYDKASAHAKTYSLSSSENPVGYSGSLGLKMLINRIEGIVDQLSGEIYSIESLLNTKRNQAGAAIETPTEFGDFVEHAFAFEAAQQSESLKTQSMSLQAQAREEYARAERSRFLPRIGLFGNGNLTTGSGDTGTSGEFGAYLRWELFSPSNLGVANEAKLSAEAFKNRTQAEEENVSAGKDALVKNVPILKRNLKRAYDSILISSEQAKVTEQLFRRGAVNALQLSEVLSRRADAILATHEIEMAYLDSLANQFLLVGGAL